MTQPHTLTPELELFVNTRVKYYADKAREVFASEAASHSTYNGLTTWATPTVEFFYVGTTAGFAYYKSQKVTFNVGLLIENIDTFDNIIGHEVAHLVADRLYLERGHGRNWKHVMRMLGLSPNRCHNYNTDRVRRKNARATYEYVCLCPSHTHHVTLKTHNRIVSGHQAGSPPKCRKCKCAVTLKPGFVLPTEVAAPTKTTKASSKSSTKLSRAIAIVNSNPTMSRKELIAMFVDKLGMTQAGASTYYYNAKK